MQRECQARFLFTLFGLQMLAICMYIVRQPTTGNGSLNYVDKERSAANKELGQSAYSMVNKKRVDFVRKFCNIRSSEVRSSYPNYNSLPSGIVNYVWMLSPHHNLFYCATPKCASTTWKSYLMEDQGIEINADTHIAAMQLSMKKQFSLRRPPYDHLSLLQVVNSKNRMVIVRNPWARLVSFFQNKVSHSHWPLKKICIAHAKYPQNITVTFNTFIDCLTKSSRRQLWNIHIHPLTSLCAFCQMDYNIIVKLEEMAEAEEFIKSKLNFSNPNIKYKPPRKGQYSNTYASYYKNLTSGHIHHLQDIYALDIQLFGYPSSPFE